MLRYTQAEETSKNVAVFYAKKLNSPLAESFFAGEHSPANTTEAVEIANAFWEITELASEDHLNNVPILDGIDIEFWVHKLFNRIYGYYEKNGYKDVWKTVEEKHH